VLDEYIVEEHEFRLSKNDGSPAQQVSRFANLCLRYGDRTSTPVSRTHGRAKEYR